MASVLPWAMRRVLTFLLILAAAPVLAAETIPGPVNARVISVYDGDTITVDAILWLGLPMRTSIRLDGVDTPEIRGRCQAEKDLAIRARDFVRARVGTVVKLYQIRYGKYAGRVVARVHTEAGADIAKALISAGLGREYRGGRRAGWCP